MPYPFPSTPGIAVLLLTIAGCAASPAGPEDHVALPPAALAEAGARASLQIQRRGELLRELDTLRYVRCVADALIRTLPDDPGNWEVVVLRDEKPDAYALAGRRLGVTKGLIRVADNQDRLAAALAHGIAHERLGHTAAHVTPAVAEALTRDEPLPDFAIAALGGAAEVNSGFAYSATEESAADAFALERMAKAGFDPSAAAQVWSQLQAYRVREGTSGERPPAMLLVHPADRARIQTMGTPPATVVSTFDVVRLGGNRPDCGRQEESER